jgi:hypothetical protein
MFVVERTERSAAQRGAGPNVKDHIAKIVRWREIEYDQAEAFESFERSGPSTSLTTAQCA